MFLLINPKDVLALKVTFRSLSFHEKSSEVLTCKYVAVSTTPRAAPLM